MKIIRPRDSNNKNYYLIGGLIIILNYIRHKLFGYKTPRPFSIDQIDRAVDYDFNVIENWVSFLNKYSNKSVSLRGKTVLELGVGPDLGTGPILLAKGVEKYTAVDVFDLANTTPVKFYKKLFDRLEIIYPDCDIENIKEQLNKCYKREDSNLKYIVDKNFEISKIRDKFDIVFSQAAFEHFTDAERVIAELSSIVKDGGVLITEIDLQTHTRWIHDRDPLNVYRYNNLFWNLFRFKGSLNRTRAFEYKGLLEKNNWVDIKIEPLTILDDKYLEKVRPTLNKKFRQMDFSEIKMLSIMLMATKSDT